MARDRNDDVRAIIEESARVQVASLNAAIAFWSGWVERASEFAASTSRELLRVTDKDASTDDAIGRLTDSTRTYLRRMTELPQLAADRFNDELKAKSPPAREARKRAARVKP